MKILRIATYNIHRCQGIDARTKPERVAAVLREIDADVVALQEVINWPPESGLVNQTEFLAKAAGYKHAAFGGNRLHKNIAEYGNAVLSRCRIVQSQNYDITRGWRERRGVLRTDLQWNGKTLHFFNAHLSTMFFERRKQGHLLLSRSILKQMELTGPRLVVGDFNEWTRGLTTRMMSAAFEAAGVKQLRGAQRTFPGLAPVLGLDHIYHDPELELRSLRVHRSRITLVASDHLPLVAEFEWSGRQAA